MKSIPHGTGRRRPTEITRPSFPPEKSLIVKSFQADLGIITLNKTNRNVRRIAA
jgi:hypothetical protein